uniref:C2 domain-containing protein n=1 Tax=Syphacia muris TaxID=451379 RepID=A0A158R633_9BILA
MDGLSWLILSWIVVGAFCYFILNKLGTPQTSAKKTVTSNSKASSTTNCTIYSIDSSEWTNEVLAWLFANMHRVPAPLEAWINALNEAAKKISSPSKCEVMFEGFGNNSNAKPPKLSQISVEQGPRDHLTIKTTLNVPEINLKLVSSQRSDNRLLITNYDAQIRDLHGEIESRVACIANQVYLMGCFTGRPELDILLKDTDSNTVSYCWHSSILMEEAIRRCLVSAVTNISLSDAFSSTQQNQLDDRSSTTVVAPVQEMMKRLNQSYVTLISFFWIKILILIAPSTNLSTLPNKLRVKVIRAQRLGKDADVNQPYVVIEMDEPAQKHTTSKGLNMSPYWEETFEFDLTPASEEILFEIYEDTPNGEEEHRFLGLAIVGFEEIRRSGESVHSLTLQGRPYRNDEVSGTLTVQFDFFFDANVTTLGKQVDEITVRNSDGAEFRETVSTSKRPIYDPHGYDVIPTKTTTVVVKTVSQQAKDKPLISSVHGSMENAMDPTTARTIDKMNIIHLQLSAKVSSLQSLNYIKVLNKVIRMCFHRRKKVRDDDLDEKRSFFGSLRHRLSSRHRSKARAKSEELNDELEEAVSLPPSRDQSQARYSERPLSRSNYEEISVGGKSAESSKSLYLHSTLVLEIVKNGETKHILIPPSVIDEPAATKLFKRGKKLHIYNEHTFVAVKIKGSLCYSVMKQARCFFQYMTFQSAVKQLQVSKDIDWSHFLSHYQLEEYISENGV